MKQQQIGMASSESNRIYALSAINCAVSAKQAERKLVSVNDNRCLVPWHRQTALTNSSSASESVGIPKLGVSSGQPYQ